MQHIQSLNSALSSGTAIEQALRQSWKILSSGGSNITYQKKQYSNPHKTPSLLFPPTKHTNSPLPRAYAPSVPTCHIFSGRRVEHRQTPKQKTKAATHLALDHSASETSYLTEKSQIYISNIRTLWDERKQVFCPRHPQRKAYRPIFLYHNNKYE